jgi:hypothetical protein
MNPKLWTPDQDCQLTPGGIAVLGQFAVRNQLPDRSWSNWAKFPNGATTLGLNYLLNAGFRGIAPSTTWYIGLINDSGFTGLAAADTSALHPGWTELTTYTSTPRLTWSPNAAVSGSVTITSALTFTTNADSLIRGAFLANSSTKGSVVDLIYGTGVEAAARSILSGLTYQLYYTITLTPTS